MQLFSVNDIDSCKKLPYKCEYCGKIFYKNKDLIKKAFAPSNSWRNTYKYCSLKCHHAACTKRIKIKCKQCNKELYIIPYRINKSKSGNFFCSRSCAATYNNTHRKTGTRQSKLELWLKDKLSILYPNLEILYCDKTTINSELDIYIPSLKLAFELNGIYHYEPIHSMNKLKQKYQACLENNIELCIIDASQLKYFKERNCIKYLDIVTKIINLKIK